MEAELTEARADHSDEIVGGEEGVDTGEGAVQGGNYQEKEGSRGKVQLALHHMQDYQEEEGVHRGWDGVAGCGPLANNVLAMRLQLVIGEGEDQLPQLETG